MMASLTESSLKQYDSALKKWWSFCSANSVDPFTSSIRDILAGLTDAFEKGVSYSTLNCLRSAISLVVGHEIGQDPNIKRFFKGVFNKRPPRPRYDCTWDPKAVLDYLSSKANNKTTTLKVLSMKLISLLALVTGHRLQTFALLDIRNIRETAESIEIKVPDRIKTSGPSRKQPCLVLPFYTEDKEICVASTLKSYLERIKDIRGSTNSLFISFKKPFKAVTSQTLSRWIKEILSKSGINTEIFTAYSTRHAATSAARRHGVDLDIIRKTAGWTSNSKTFAKFYNRDIAKASDVFARAIY
ncbi:uncharacterized protein [Temnothorax longispinosus]|uniref:uncharacterized protein n=1 Tax=Temnothorax longispinosus TaxID=300112 RepID=UPI003A997575